MIGTLRELLPDPLADMIARLDKSTAEQLEEIRIREGKPLEVDFQGTYAFLSRNGNSCTHSGWCVCAAQGRLSQAA